MKTVIWISLLPLGACGVSENLAATMAVGANVVSVAAIQRTPADAVYSWWTGRDCSIVRLDRGLEYCRPVDPAPLMPPFCTRSLGVVDCWANPADMPGGVRGVADGPAGLTAPQEADRVRTWP